MHPHDSADRLPLIKSLDDVNSKVRLVRAAYTHYSQWQKGPRFCSFSSEQLLIARTLLVESIEEWALAVGCLLRLTRMDASLKSFSDGLERSLRRAAAYLSAAAAIAVHVRQSECG